MDKDANSKEPDAKVLNKCAKSNNNHIVVFYFDKELKH